MFPSSGNINGCMVKKWASHLELHFRVKNKLEAIVMKSMKPYRLYLVIVKNKISLTFAMKFMQNVCGKEKEYPN